MNLRKLSDVAELIGGFAFKSTDFTTSGIPLVRIGEICESGIEFNNRTVFVSEENVISKSKFIVKKKDVLVALSGATTGKFAMYQSDEVALLNQRVLIVRKNSDINSKYLYYSMYALKGQIEYKAAGAAQPNISPNQIGSLLIPVPPLEIQKKIVEVLDKAQGLIDVRKEQIRLMDELIQSVFYEMFGDPVSNPKGWEVKKLDKVLKIDTKMIKDFENYNDYAHIGIDSIEKNTGQILNYRTVGEDKPISGKYLFDSRHIIYSKIRPNLNKVALPNFSGLCSADAYPLLVDNKMAMREFIASILKSEFFLSEILKHSTRTNIPKVNKKQLLDFECIMPAVELQKIFTQKMDQIELQKTLLKKSMRELEENYYSIMQKAFKGDFGGER